VFNLFISDLEKALHSEATHHNTLLFTIVNSKAGCKGMAKIHAWVMKSQPQDGKGLKEKKSLSICKNTGLVELLALRE